MKRHTFKRSIGFPQVSRPSSFARRRKPYERFTLAEMLEARTLLSSTFVVTNTNDAGGGSLRQAIMSANTSGDSSNLITFDIAGSGPQVISLLSALPAIYNTVTIDGTTQPGYSGSPLVELDGSSVSSDDYLMPGLELDGSGDVVRGLHIYHFYDGIDVNGPRANDVGFHGDHAQIIGNYIGLAPMTVDGFTIYGNRNNGIDIEGGFAGSGLADGAVISGNVIYGNNPDGIYMIHVGSASITGNIIGLDPSGTLWAGNANDGIHLVDCSNVTIGGTAAADRNVISGNNGDGVTLEDSSSNVIRGNYIGTDISGMLATDANDEFFGNGGDGVRIEGRNTNCTDNLVAGNVISNNGGDGIGVEAYDTDPDAPNIVIDNLIGTNASGTAPLGNDGNGIALIEGSLVIGQPGHGNIISGNLWNGISLDDAAVVQGNRIGLGADGSPMGNGHYDGLGNPLFNGIFIDADGSTIGGTQPGQGNTIAYNTVNGIDVASGSHNNIRGNSIYSNGALGIDLGGDGPVLDGTHANNGQIFPVLTSITRSGALMMVSGTLTTAPGVYAIDVFSSTVGNASGYGEGPNYLGSVTVTVGASGTASFTAGFGGVANDQTVASATATDSSGNTSEFSADAAIPPAITPTTTMLLSSVDPSVFGQSITLTATVTGTGSPTGSVLFMDGATVLGAVAVDVNGVASLTLSSLSVGDHAITATYGGDDTHSTSDAALTQTVNKSRSATTLSASSSSTSFGQAITFTATVSIADMGAGTRTGLVTFMDGTAVLGTAAVDSNGFASLTVSTLAVGSHSATASYAGDANFTASDSNAVNVNVSLIDTATTLSSSMPSSVYGQPVTLSAMVMAASGSVPTGSVMFMDGATVLGTATLDASGMATLTLSSLSVGSHSVTATYGGSATDAASTSAPLSQSVSKVSTATMLTSSADPSVYGQAVTLTATISGDGSPTGSVMFMEGSTVLGTVALDASGQASLTLSSLSVGGHDISASYSGDDTHAGSSASLTQTVNRDKTVTKLKLSATTIDFGDSVVFTAKVDINDLGTGTPTGTVTFMDGSNVVGTAALGSDGYASFTATSQSVGGHVITAIYSGDINFAGSISNSVSESVNMLGTSTSLSSSMNPSKYGQSILFTATVSGGLGATGMITFSDGTTLLGTVAVDSSGTATLTVSSLAVGGHTILATYGGDANNAGSSASLTQTVNKISTGTSLSSSSTNASYGQPVTFTATVSNSGAGVGSPSGNVVFMDGSTLLGTAAIGAGGIATLTVSSLSVGGHAITATYGGDAAHTGSSASLAQSVIPRVTSTVLAASFNPSVYGQAVAFTATVSNGGAGGLSGSVVFKDGSTVLGTAAVNASGVATISVSSLAVGGHAITAAYSGNPNNAASSASLAQTVNKDKTNTTVTSSSSTISSVEPVTFTATVMLADVGAGTPSGTVTFTDGSTVLGTSTLSAGGVATLMVSSLSFGSHQIVATYSGDANFLSSANSTPLGVVSTAGILLLDPTGRGALTESGNARIIANGATIFVDSASASAVVLSGNVSMQAALLDITGGDTTSGNSHLDAVVETGLHPMADPLAGVPTPTTAGLTLHSAASVSGDQVVTLNPGVYVGGITLSGNAKVTLNPGVYYMQGGGFTVSGNASVTDLGNGVLIYNAPVRSSDGIHFTGNGSVQLSPMTSGSWAGISLFQARGASAAMTVSGNGALNVAGAIYATGATLQVTGNAGVAVNGSILSSFGTTLILDDLVVSGNGCLVV